MASYELFNQTDGEQGTRGPCRGNIAVELRDVLVRFQLTRVLMEAKSCRGKKEYRIRQGDYRVIYEINDATMQVTVVKIGHRGDVYRK